MEEKLFRNRVAWMMFLLSILVIWDHSYNVELFAGRAPGVAFEQALPMLVRALDTTPVL